MISSYRPLSGVDARSPRVPLAASSALELDFVPRRVAYARSRDIASRARRARVGPATVARAVVAAVAPHRCPDIVINFIDPARASCVARVANAPSARFADIAIDVVDALRGDARRARGRTRGAKCGFRNRVKKRRARTTRRRRATRAMFLRDAAKKLERENAREQGRLRDKIAVERAENARKEALRKQLDDEKMRARAREREQRRAEEAMMVQNEGVSYDARLFAQSSDAARRRGIRARGEDKAQLPASAAASVGANRSGRAHFCVSRGERKTHVGVLDYGSVDSGTIGLPEPVMRTLGLTGDAAREDGADADARLVRVTYAALPLGTKMTLKPRMNDFARDFVDQDVREVLERVMMGRSAATVGDEVVVASTTDPSKTYELKVTAVEPDDGFGAVSLLETDVEVELEPSEEYERVMDEIAARERRRKEEFLKAKEALAERERAKLAEQEAFETRKATLRASIAPEPSAARGTPGVVALRFSLPNGAVKMRKFDANASTIRDVFDYARSLDDAVLSMPTFELTTRAGEVVLREDGGDAPALAALDAQTFFVRASS